MSRQIRRAALREEQDRRVAMHQGGPAPEGYDDVVDGDYKEV